MKPANRINKIEEYYFSRKLAEVRDLQNQGKPIINLGIGNPDFEPHPEVLKELIHATYQTGSNHYQSYRGLPELRMAFSNWYKNIYSVDLNPDTEILPLIGSKEGIMHIHMAFCNSGDTVLIPDPGYPAYSTVAKLLNLKIEFYNLKKENNWLPDFNELEKLAGDNCKLMWINYPHMPTGKSADYNDLKRLVDFAKARNILLVNDNPYSVILNDNPKSILNVCESNSNVLELNSLSKSHNMAGWRVGMIAGSEININHIVKVKSNFDSGMFKPVQEAAVKALNLDNSWYTDLNNRYTVRQNAVWKLLDEMSCTYDKSAVGMFVWAKVPANFKNGEAFADYLLYEKEIFVTPGLVFGENGDMYVRLSLCAPTEKLEEALSRVKSFKCEKVCELE